VCVPEDDNGTSEKSASLYRSDKNMEVAEELETWSQRRTRKGERARQTGRAIEKKRNNRSGELGEKEIETDDSKRVIAESRVRSGECPAGESPLEGGERGKVFGTDGGSEGHEQVRSM